MGSGGKGEGGLAQPHVAPCGGSVSTTTTRPGLVPVSSPLVVPGVFWDAWNIVMTNQAALSKWTGMPPNSCVCVCVCV